MTNSVLGTIQSRRFCLRLRLQQQTQLGTVNRSYVLEFFIYRKGNIVKDPMKKGSFVPKNVPMVGWGGSCWGEN